MTGWPQSESDTAKLVDRVKRQDRLLRQCLEALIVPVDQAAKRDLVRAIGKELKIPAPVPPDPRPRLVREPAGLKATGEAKTVT